MSDVKDMYLEDHLSLIEVSGEDSLTFLQGQITNDINLVTEETMIYAGLCNPKGRLLAFFHILKFCNNYYLICPKSIEEKIIKKLSMFILRDKVLIKNPEELTLTGLKISSDHSILGKKVKACSLDMQSTSFNKVHITRLSKESDIFLMVGSRQSLKELLLEDENLKIISYKEWKKHYIQRNIPNIYLATQDKYIPQSLNLDLINAISFKKGCYTGQEIIARTHYLGKIKKRMFAGKCASSDELNYGDEVFSKNDVIGFVIDYMRDSSTSYLLMELRVDTKIDSLKVKDMKIELLKSPYLES